MSAHFASALARRVALAAGLRLALAAAVVLTAPAAAHACSACSVLTNIRNLKAFLDSTLVLSLLPLALIAGGLWWLARRASGRLGAEFRESDEAAAAPPSGPAER